MVNNLQTVEYLDSLLGHRDERTKRKQMRIRVKTIHLMRSKAFAG